MNQETRTSMENLLQQMTGFDDCESGAGQGNFRGLGH